MPYLGKQLGFTNLAGDELFLDADSDTSITASTDDQIDIKIGGADDFAFKANSFEVQGSSNIDMNGQELILDADADTSITADTDDQIDFKIGGADIFNITQSGNISIFTNVVDDADMIFRVSDGGSAVDAIRIDASLEGFVGINTASPSNQLHVTGSNATARGIAITNSENSKSCDLSVLGSSYGAHGASAGEVWLYNADGVTLGSATGNSGGVKLVAGGSSRLTVASNGNVTIGGALSKGSGSFKINHPLESKKDTHYLVHSFIEGPQADLIYRGTATLSSGTATINIDTVSGMTDGTFVALNTGVQCFTNNESGWTAVKGSVSGNTLTITAQDNSCTDTISWMVIGERQDPHIKDSGTDWTTAEGKPILEPEIPEELRL